jgi:hypothetical protein
MRTKRKRAWWPWLVFAMLGLGVLVYAVGPLLWELSFGRPGQADFYLHQSKYRNIVTQVKGLPLAAGAKTSTRVDGLFVNATRSAAGSYTVTITTVDWNHAGVYGYVFSDDPLTPHPTRITRTFRVWTIPARCRFQTSGSLVRADIGGPSTIIYCNVFALW